MMTNMGAPKRKLVGFNISNPMPEQWKDVIAEDKDPLDNVSLCGEGICQLHAQCKY